MQVSHLGIIVLDEAHHCDRDHPYALLLREFWAREGESEDEEVDPNLGVGESSLDVPVQQQAVNRSRPMLIGLTASPVQVRFH